VKSLTNEIRVSIQTEGSHCLRKAAHPLHSRVDARLIAKVADPPVPVMEEVADAGEDTSLIVDQNRVSGHPDRRSVDEDQFDARCFLTFKERLGTGGRHHDQPIHPASEECGENFALSFLTLVRTSGQHKEAVAARDLSHRPGKSGVERIGQVLDDQPDAGSGQLVPQAAGDLVTAEVQTRNRSLHALGGGFGHASLAVHHPGDRLEADPGQPRDVVHGGAYRAASG